MTRKPKRDYLVLRDAAGEPIVDSKRERHSGLTSMATETHMDRVGDEYKRHYLDPDPPNKS